LSDKGLASAFIETFPPDISKDAFVRVGLVKTYQDIGADMAE